MGDSNLFGAKGPRLQHLVRGAGGLAGEINDLRADIDEAFGDMESSGGYLVTEEFVDPPLADVDAIKTAEASAAAEQVFVAVDLDGAVGNAEMVPPRNLSITTTASGDIDAVDVVITGRVRDRTGALIAQTETITLTADAGATDLGALAFSIVDTITIPAQTGTGGTVAFGFGAIIGMANPMKTLAGLLAPTQEIAVGVVVTTGTFVDAATATPNGTYEPAAAPDAANDYAITYLVD